MPQQYDHDKNNLLMEIEEEILKSHLNIFIMTNIKSIGELGGYDVILRFREKFALDISVGTVYAQLYALERKKLIECNSNPNETRKYILTPKGVKTLDIILTLKPQLLTLVDTVFSLP